MQKDEPRKLRSDLTEEQRERAERIGRIGGNSARYSNCSWGVAHKFIPSEKQH